MEEGHSPVVAVRLGGQDFYYGVARLLDQRFHAVQASFRLNLQIFQQKLAGFQIINLGSLEIHNRQERGDNDAERDYRADQPSYETDRNQGLIAKDGGFFVHNG